MHEEQAKSRLKVSQYTVYNICLIQKQILILIVLIIVYSFLVVLKLYVSNWKQYKNIGKYTKGTRDGQMCIVKKFIDPEKRALSESDYLVELKATYAAIRFCEAWDKLIKIKHKDNPDYKRIHVVQPMPAQNITETDPTLSDIENENENENENSDKDCDNENSGSIGGARTGGSRSRRRHKRRKARGRDDTSGVRTESDSDSDIDSELENENDNANENINNQRLNSKSLNVFRNEWIMVEPFLKGDFVKFNANNGLVREKYIEHVLQAFSHFTYHVSGGKRIFCDLQGVERSDMIILTDPCILSNEKGKFGATDLGQQGIIRFMIAHDCNEYCDPNWRKLDDEMIAEYTGQRNPSMMRLDIVSQEIATETQSVTECDDR